MIGATGRGLQFGYESARSTRRTATSGIVERLASLTYARLTRLGYAHIEPRSEFCTAFVTGFYRTVGRKAV